jgi:biotin synthase-like enzyme
VGGVQADRVVVGEDVVDLDAEVAAGQLNGLGEEAEDGVDAWWSPASWLRPGGVPDDVGVEQLP